MSDSPTPRSVLPRATFVALIVVFVSIAQLPWWHRTASVRRRPITPALFVEPDHEAKLEPGLTLSFAAAIDAAPADARTARLVALSVPAGGVATPLLPPGPFVATWTGNLQLKIHDGYRFAAVGRGHLTVTINDVAVFDADGDLGGHPTAVIELKSKANRLAVRYTPPPTGDATVRLLWAIADKPDQFNPIPPTNFTHDVAADLIAKHAGVRAGRTLIAEMRCMACHQSSAPAATAMPELKQDAPDLTHVAARLTPEYLAYWITNPKALRPTSAMPNVLHGPSDKPTVDPRAWDIAAYLTDGAPARAVLTPKADDDTVGRGGRLFTGLGCVACHVAPGTDDANPEFGRVPLKYVAAQFLPGQLREFLHAPEAHYAWSRMPNFRLSDDELTDLSGYLLAKAPIDALPPVGLSHGDAAKGKAAFAAAGCVSCHAGPDGPAHSTAAVDLAHADFARGCLADDAAHMGNGVDYALTPEQRDAVRSMAATDWKPTLDRDPPAEFAARQLVAARCVACHNYDNAKNETNSYWSQLDADVQAIEGSLPPTSAKPPEGDQTPPPLTWAGEKLRPAWSATFIAGKVGYKPRDWMLPRMPSFASRAAGLSTGVAQMHGCGLADPPPPADLANAAAGKMLTDQTYFGCVKCHSVAQQAAIAPFEAYAPNLAHVSDRLTHDYYRRWMLNPSYYSAGTKMPAFANAQGKTAFDAVLGGDANAEFDAIWQYVQAGPNMSPPP